jgi:hypothetical protein
MTKINRLAGNVKAFASEAPANERTIFDDVIKSDELDDNINASFMRGFGVYGSNDFPKLSDFNAAGWTISQLTSYLYQMGMAEWHQKQEYFDDSFTNYNGRIYVSGSNDNIGVNPETNISVDITPGIAEPLTVSNLSSMVAFKRYAGLAQEFAYIDETSIQLKRYHYDSSDYSDISTTTLASLGITPGNNVVSCRTSDNRFFLGYDNQFHIIECDWGTGALTVKFSDTTNVLAMSGGNPYTCCFRTVQHVDFEGVFLLINGSVETWTYGILTNDFIITDGSITPETFAYDSPIVEIGQVIVIPNDPLGDLIKPVFCVCDTSTGTLSVYLEHDNGVFLGSLSYGDCKLMSSSEDYNIMISSVDPTSGFDLIQRLTINLDYTSPLIFTTSFSINGDKYDTGSAGIQSMIGMQEGSTIISNYSNDNLINYFYNDSSVFKWSLFGAGSTGFNGSGTALASTNTEDAIKEVLNTMMYGIGSIHESATDDRDPAIILGFGTWTQIKGRFIVGVDDADPYLDTGGEMGGNRVLTAASHVLTVDEIPSHTHTIGNDPGSTAVPGSFVRSESQETGQATTDATGGGLGHEHDINGATDNTSLPPFLTVYMWLRTA